MIYTSINNPKIKQLKKLSQKKYRDQTNTFLIEGMHLIKEAEKANCLQEVFVLEGNHVDTTVSVNEVSINVMKFLSQLETPPVAIGLCTKLKEDNIGNKILMLDCVQDPGNLGTIIRSAVAFNIDTIIISEDTVDLYNSKVIRASQGMLFHTNILVKKLSKEIKKLKETGYKIYSTKVTSGKELKNVEKSKKFVIIMGNEGNGVSKNLLDLADDYIYIPMDKRCESLNVAVATSIILYEISR
ncbi:MAG: RNA methyltransferase [Bacilli bacterium]|nr:RNA methyltransferase [Bacilli bacterium]